MQVSGQNPFTFQVIYQESIDYHYERIYEPTHDPRVGHQMVLEVDKFGNVHKIRRYWIWTQAIVTAAREGS